MYNGIALDTETGGLSERTNPLLSIAIAVSNEKWENVDGYEIKVAPPQGTLLQIPKSGYYGLKCTLPTHTSHYMDVYTREEVSAEVGKDHHSIIAAYAAETNGYVGKEARNGIWDWSAMTTWNTNSMHLVQAEEDLLSHLTSFFGPTPPTGTGHVVTVAHNASFDQRFVQYHMPRLFAKLKNPWFCTCNASRAYFKAKGVKGSAKLTEMAKLSGHDYQNAHEAYADVEATLSVLRFLQREKVKGTLV